ncbi:uncharacterized protein B0H18DRAFT_1029397 [Fomitopsis serialis]|uniref:uncharacterized protein n=1 Tax=Fomitopsis serialis TaxID=139415 RepID=UPI002008BCFC|nr:uncharacterized protein B0H18DRAFT_1029397 [Neoantrodia serialis]KAH9919017.1 hypothetical protein B0H18DRAFT_1029397 [Neoantrodia serialis]
MSAHSPSRLSWHAAAYGSSSLTTNGNNRGTSRVARSGMLSTLLSIYDVSQPYFGSAAYVPRSVRHRTGATHGRSLLHTRSHRAPIHWTALAVGQDLRRDTRRQRAQAPTSRDHSPPFAVPTPRHVRPLGAHCPGRTVGREDGLRLSARRPHICTSPAEALVSALKSPSPLLDVVIHRSRTVVRAGREPRAGGLWYARSAQHLPRAATLRSRARVDRRRGMPGLRPARLATATPSDRRGTYATARPRRPALLRRCDGLQHRTRWRRRPSPTRRIQPSRTRLQA